MSVESIGVVARSDRREALELSSRIVDYSSSKGLKVLLEPAVAKFRGGSESGVPVSDMEVNLLVVVGGNGTLLRACRSLPKPETPILGINMGTKGLLMEVKPEEAFKAIDRCLKGKHLIEKCMKLSSSINSVTLPDALNDVLLTASEHAKILRFKIYGEGLSIECLADGLIFSSPLGSTAHSFSAGGPVVNTALDAFLLTPICPFTVFRPIVFPSSSTVEVRLAKPQAKANVIIDGMYEGEMTPQDSLTVTRSKHKAALIRFGEDFRQKRLEKRLFL